MEGVRVLDIFAGSGSLGCEALSRGAGSATFVDSSRAAVKTIEMNLDALGVADRARILAIDVYRAMDELAARNEQFDLIFVDAPYKNDLSNEVVERIGRLGLLAPDGWIVVGQSKRAPAAPEAPEGLTRPNVVTLGDHRIAFYRRPSDAAPGGN